MSKGGQQLYSDDLPSDPRDAKTSRKSVVITRSSGNPVRTSYSSSARLSSGFGSINPNVFTSMTSSSLSDFKHNRDKEKRDMQENNERLASYIEKVRWLEAKNKKMDAEVEALRARKQEDWKPIRDMYESELCQARKIIAEMSSEKGIDDAKRAGLQDEIASLRGMLGQMENYGKDYNKKIDALNNQVGEYEGELTTLRLRCGSMEDELQKVRGLFQKLRDENTRLRTDLDSETQCHIEQEVLAQTKTEECEFLNELLEKLQVMKEEPVKIKGLDLETYFKGELRKTVSDLNQQYDDLYNRATLDMESKYMAQLDQLKAGNTRDAMESEHSKTEIKRLRDNLSDLKARLAEIESALASAKVERDNFCMMVSEKDQELDRERCDGVRRMKEAQDNIEILVAQLNELTNAKMDLEVEICCYRKLLEGEENRSGLRQLVEQTIGTQSRGGGALAEMIGQSTLNSSSTAKTQVQRSSKGPVGFQTVDQTGASVTIENSSTGARQRPVKLTGWKVVKVVNGKVLCEVGLGDRVIQPGRAITLFAKGAKDKTQNPETEVIIEQFSWGSGDGIFKLMDDQGQEKATLTVQQL